MSYDRLVLTCLLSVIEKRAQVEQEVIEQNIAFSLLTRIVQSSLHPTNHQTSSFLQLDVIELCSKIIAKILQKMNLGYRIEIFFFLFFSFFFKFQTDQLITEFYLSQKPLLSTIQNENPHSSFYLEYLSWVFFLFFFFFFFFFFLN